MFCKGYLWPDYKQEMFYVFICEFFGFDMYYL